MYCILAFRGFLTFLWIPRILTEVRMVRSLADRTFQLRVRLPRIGGDVVRGGGGGLGVLLYRRGSGRGRRDGVEEVREVEGDSQGRHLFFSCAVAPRTPWRH